MALVRTRREPACLFVWELFTFELPREPVSEVWRQRAWLHTFVVLGIAIATFAGALAGFRMLPANRMLKKRRIAVFGALFALPAFSLLVMAMEATGPVGGFVALVVMAAAAAYVGGRLLSRHAA